MGRADLYSRSIQRMVTNGDVIYVHSPKPAAAPPPPANPEPEAEPDPQGVLAAEQAEQPTQSGEESWLYTQAPDGYAVEFGTGRLVRVRSSTVQPQIVQGTPDSTAE